MNSFLTLVNKEHSLALDYSPMDLMIVDNNENNFHEYLDPYMKPLIRRAVLVEFYRMKKEALKEGYNIIIDSAFRTSRYQGRLWDEELKKNREELIKKYDDVYDRIEIERMAVRLTDSYVARPGHSEHQTGLAFDMGVMKDNKLYNGDVSEEYEWMKNNAYMYGFILRYPENKKDITGFEYEPWHYRFIGLPHSYNCHENDYTFEEYHELVLKK